MRQLDRERLTCMRFFAWMLTLQSGGFHVTGPEIAAHWRVSLDTAYRWRADYFAARGMHPMRLPDGRKWSEAA